MPDPTSSHGIASQPPRPRDPRVGTRLGKYLLVRQLGQGGMGVVYEAEDVLLKRQVAVKLLHATVSADQDAARRFLQEAQLAARLNHPNVVTIHEVDEHQGTLYLVMELVHGVTAHEYLRRRGALHWRTATQVTAAVCRGLVAAHAKGLIHRDVKPANVMWSADGLVKLADFGLARAAEGRRSRTELNFIPGTPAYMSPEQCRHDELDDLSDVYSLGATYFALLTGKPPYDGASAVDVMFAHCSQPIPDPRSVNSEMPPACAAIVRQALAKSPADRFASAAALLAALEAILSPPVAAARPAHTRSGQSRRWWLGIGAVLAACVVVCALVWQPRRPAAAVRDEARAAPAWPEGHLPPPDQISEAGARVAMNGTVEAVAFSPNGFWLAAAEGGSDGGLVVWNRTSGRREFDRRVREFAPSGPGGTSAIRSLSFSADSNLLAVGLEDGAEKKVHVLRMVSPPEFRPPPASRRGGVPAVAFASSGAMLATVVRSARAGAVRVMMPQRQGEVRTFPGAFAALAFSSRNRLALGGRSRTITVWDAGTDATTELPAQREVCSLAFLPNDEWLAACGSGELQIWHVPQRICARAPTRDDVRQVAAYSRGGLLATAEGDGVRLWSPRPPRVLHTLAGHEGAAHAVAFDPRNPLLASGGADRSLRLWDVSQLVPNQR